MVLVKAEKRFTFFLALTRSGYLLIVDRKGWTNQNGCNFKQTSPFERTECNCASNLLKGLFYRKLNPTVLWIHSGAVFSKKRSACAKAPRFNSFGGDPLFL